MFWITKLWTQSIMQLLKNTNSVKRLHLLQENNLGMLFFQSRNSHTWPLFRDYKIIKSFDKTTLENCIFINPSVYSSRLQSVILIESQFHNKKVGKSWLRSNFFLPNYLKPMVDIWWPLMQYLFGIT